MFTLFTLPEKSQVIHDIRSQLHRTHHDTAEYCSADRSSSLGTTAAASFHCFLYNFGRRKRGGCPSRDHVWIDDGGNDHRTHRKRDQ